jgi:hypothetical protein
MSNQGWSESAIFVAHLHVALFARDGVSALSPPWNPNMIDLRESG